MDLCCKAQQTITKQKARRELQVYMLMPSMYQSTLILPFCGIIIYRIYLNRSHTPNSNQTYSRSNKNNSHPQIVATFNYIHIHFVIKIKLMGGLLVPMRAPYVYCIAGKFRGYKFSLFSQIDMLPRKSNPPKLNF